MVLNSSNNHIGTKYDITTQHHGKEGKMIYELTKYKEDYDG